MIAHYMVTRALEDYGFCAKARAGAWCSPARLRLGGKLHQHIGGQLSEAHVEGMLQIVEGVAPVAADNPATRQVKDAEIALISVTAAIRSAHSTLILERGR